MTTALRGFTLAELMVVSALVGLVVAASATLIWQTDGARRRVARDAAAWAEADAAIHVLSTALANAYRPAADDELVNFEGVSDEIGGLPADRIHFFTVSHHNVRHGQPESDVREVEFGLYMDPQLPLPVLRRRLDPTLNPPPDGGGVVDDLADNVVSLDIRYFDGITWYDEWLATYNQMPAAVRVTVEVVKPNVYDFDPRPPQRVALTRLIALPRMPLVGQTGDATQGAQFNTPDDTGISGFQGRFQGGFP